MAVVVVVVLMVLVVVVLVMLSASAGAGAGGGGGGGCASDGGGGGASGDDGTDCESVLVVLVLEAAREIWSRAPAPGRVYVTPVGTYVRAGQEVATSGDRQWPVI